MTHAEAITELVRIWHSPHLDLSLKAGLAEVIDTLKETNQGESLVRDDAENCKESESKLDLISRQDALCILKKKMIDRPLDSDRWVIRDIAVEIKSLPSAEAVEVVRCKECRHSRIEGDTTMFMWCGYWNKPTDGIRYCSDGERREP